MRVELTGPLPSSTFVCLAGIWSWPCLRPRPSAATLAARPGCIDTLGTDWSVFFYVRRDLELAKFEAFLKNQNARHIKANVRGKQRLAYPIKR